MVCMWYQCPFSVYSYTPVLIALDVLSDTIDSRHICSIFLIHFLHSPLATLDIAALDATVIRHKELISDEEVDLR